MGAGPPSRLAWRTTRRGREEGRTPGGGPPGASAAANTCGRGDGDTRGGGQPELRCPPTPCTPPSRAHLPGEGLPRQLGGLGGVQQADAPHDGAEGDTGAPGGSQQPRAARLLRGWWGGERRAATLAPRGGFWALLGLGRPLRRRLGFPQAAVPAAVHLPSAAGPAPRAEPRPSAEEEGRGSHRLRLQRGKGRPHRRLPCPSGRGHKKPHPPDPRGGVAVTGPTHTAQEVMVKAEPCPRPVTTGPSLFCPKGRGHTRPHPPHPQGVSRPTHLACRMPW